MYHQETVPQELKTSIQTQGQLHNTQTKNQLNIYITRNAFYKNHKIMEAASLVWNKLCTINKNTLSRPLFKKTYSICIYPHTRIINKPI